MAFTLIELLVVIAIIAILAAHAAARAVEGKGCVVQTKCLNNLKQIDLAMLNTARTITTRLPG